MRRLLVLLGMAGIVLLCSCETLVTAYLISELLDDEAPAYRWTGTVRDSTNTPVAGVEVQVRAEYEGDSNVIKFDEDTDENGEYDIKWRYHSDVTYSIRVQSGGTILAEESYGAVEKGDRETDFVIQGSTTTELSGMVSDINGDPLEDVLVIGASALTMDATPSVVLDNDGETEYYVTTASGVYNIEGAVSRYGIVCCYHPDHGFAYAWGEDSDDDGAIPLNITMGEAGDYRVQVQVVDGTASPIAMQVLPASRQFRLRLTQPWNLGAVIDNIVAEQALFPGLVGEPSDGHPETVTIDVQATGLAGIAEGALDVPGGVYELELLNISNDDAATALVTSDDPLVLADDAVVVVRVN